MKTIYSHFALRLKERFGLAINEEEYLSLQELLKSDQQLHTDIYRGAKYHAIDYKGAHIYPVILSSTGDLVTVYNKDILDNKLTTSFTLRKQGMNSLEKNKELLIQTMRKLPVDKKITRESMEEMTGLSKHEIRYAFRDMAANNLIIYDGANQCYRLKIAIPSLEKELEKFHITGKAFQRKTIYESLPDYSVSSIDQIMISKGYRISNKWFTTTKKLNFYDIIDKVTTETTADQIQALFPDYSRSQVHSALAYGVEVKKLVRVRPSVYTHKKFHKKVPVKTETISLMEVQKEKETMSLLEVARAREAFVHLKLGPKKGTDFTIVAVFGNSLVKDLNWRSDEAVDLQWVARTKTLTIVPTDGSPSRLVKGDGHYSCAFPAYFNIGLPYPGTDAKAVEGKKVIDNRLEINYSNFTIK